MSDSTATQLQLIQEVDSVLSGAGVPHWLFGGWSVDFHVGSVTRQHGDIEFFIWEHDGPRAGEHMISARYEPVDHPHPEEASIWRKDGQIVELYFLTASEHGEVVGRGRWANWPLPDHSLGTEIRVLEDIRCPVVSLECVLSTKVEYEEQIGIPPRERDRSDIVALRRALGTS
jgi:lincosamide nucleotidyltransferase A/C/D/E